MTERRLAAIVATDVVGYSRLIGADEEGTRAAMRKLRDELWDPRTEQHKGRVVKTTGDGQLLEFPSVVDAVRCSIEVQQGMADRNAGLPEDRQIVLRLGINLGDILVEDDDIHGDGVNVAARLEALAEPGGICISRAARDQVRDKLAVSFEDLGEIEVKNMARPIRTFRLGFADYVPEPPTAAASIVDVSAPVPGFDGRPAIAVLAFENLSGDTEQEYFADGIAEDILTRLAMWRWLPVIACNSSFVYKGGAVDVKQIGRELGARYVIEGSVRKAGNRVRITGQLIDAESGHHVWADKYDRDLDDIFAVQDEITEAIVAALEPAVGRAEIQRAQRMNPANLGAWDLFQRGIWRFNRFTKDDFAAAYDLMGQAIELDPQLAAALSGMAIIRVVEAIFAWTDDPGAAIKEAHEKGRAAFELDAMDPFANACLGVANTLMRQYEAAETALRRAIELNPSYALGYYGLSAHALFTGAPEPGIEAVETAIRISPNDVMLAPMFGVLSALHYMARDYERALAAADLSVQRNPRWPGAHRGRANALAQLGRMDEAKEALADLLKLTPRYTMTTGRRGVAFRDEADFIHYMEGLRLAGLPD